MRVQFFRPLALCAALALFSEPGPVVAAAQPQLSRLDSVAELLLLRTLEDLHDGRPLLETDSGRTALRRAVECALPSDQSLVRRGADGAVYVFVGGRGLAPDWRAGSCGPACAKWVATCVVSQFTASGRPLH